MRSSGNRRTDEVRAQQEQNVKRRKAAGERTKAKKVEATVDGRGIYGAKRQKGTGSYKTGFGSWRHTKEEKAKPKPEKRRKQKQSSLAGPAGGPGSNNTPTTEKPKKSNVRGQLKDMAIDLYNFGRGGVDEVSQGYIMAPGVGMWAIADKAGILEPDRDSDAYGYGSKGTQIAEVFSGPVYGMKLAQQGAKKYGEKMALKRSTEEARRKVAKGKKDSRRARVNSSFKKWSEGAGKDPKQPAPNPDAPWVDPNMAAWPKSFPAPVPGQPAPVPGVPVNPAGPFNLPAWLAAREASGAPMTLSMWKALRGM